MNFLRPGNLSLQCLAQYLAYSVCSINMWMDSFGFPHMWKMISGGLKNPYNIWKISMHGQKCYLCLCYKNPFWHAAPSHFSHLLAFWQKPQMYPGIIYVMPTLNVCPGWVAGNGRQTPAFLLNEVFISDRIHNLVFLCCVAVALIDILELFLLAPTRAPWQL